MTFYRKGFAKKMKEGERLLFFALEESWRTLFQRGERQK